MFGALMLTITITLAASCEKNNAEVIGTVRSIDDLVPIEGVAVGFAQRLVGEISLRPELTATTGAMGSYLLQNRLGPFPEGVVLFAHDDYYPDTVEFYGADIGIRARVDVNLVPLDTTVIDTAGSANRLGEGTISE